MKKVGMFFFVLLFSWLLVSCSSPENDAKLQHELSQVSTTPPVTINYTRTIGVVQVQDIPDWSKIQEGIVATTILTETSRTGGIGIPITMQAASNSKEIFLRIRWPDSDSHITPKGFMAEKLALNWGIRSQGFSSQGCGAACHFWPPAYAHGRISGMWLPERDGLADSWVWVAAASARGRIRHRLLTGKPRLVTMMSMPGMPGMKAHSMRLGFRKDPLPSMLKAEASYENGEWTLLISRGLKTANPSEVQFDPGVNPYYAFGMSVFPGTHFHNYSGLLTLHFLGR